MAPAYEALLPAYDGHFTSSKALLRAQDAHFSSSGALLPPSQEHFSASGALLPRGKAHCTPIPRAPTWGRSPLLPGRSAFDPRRRASHPRRSALDRGAMPAAHHPETASPAEEPIARA